MLLTIIEAVFFGIYGINTFFPFTGAVPILGIAAIIIAIILVVNASR